MDTTEEQYLVAIEFRYSGAPDSVGSTYRNKTTTIGVFSDREQAYKEGNKALEHLETNFPLTPRKHKERFSSNGSVFGSPKHLITNTGYLATPFQFFAKITTLKLDSLETCLDAVIQSEKEYKEYKIKELEEY